MSMEEINSDNWWEHVDRCCWEFAGIPKTDVYPEHSSASAFTMISTFIYFCEAHDDVHQRRVEGFRPEDLVDALNAVSPEICYAEVLRHLPHPDSSESRGYHLHMRDDLDALGYSVVGTTLS